MSMRDLLQLGRPTWLRAKRESEQPADQRARLTDIAERTLVTLMLKARSRQLDPELIQAW
jgi:hypothetical protein